MHKHLIFGIIGILLLTLFSCQRGLKQFTGDYSYKLSGEVQLTDADGTVSYRLIHRNGQMNILRDKSRKSAYIVTMNEMNGSCYTMNAELNGDHLQINQHEFATNILSTNGLPDLDIDLGQDEDPSIVYRVTASGEGNRNGDILIITEVWNGHQSGETHSRLYGSEMTIIAERN